VEPSGATSVAAALRVSNTNPATTVAVVSGGNSEPDFLKRLLEAA